MVCLSVAVMIDRADAEEKMRAESFLVGQKATLTNFLLNEPDETWQSRFAANGPPIIFVFDRQGKRAARFGTGGVEDFSHADVEKLVLELLDRKP